MKELTKAEEQVMQYLWRLEKALLKDVVAEFPEPRPAPTTVSTVIRVLVKKGFVDYKSYSKVHEYFPLVSKKEYFKRHMGTLIKNFFNGSVAGMASYFTENDDINLSELVQIKLIIETKISEKKKKDD